MTEEQITKAATYLISLETNSIISTAELGRMLGVSLDNQSVPMGPICKAMHKMGSQNIIQLGKKNTLRIVHTLTPQKNTNITKKSAKIVTEPIAKKIKIKPKWEGPKNSSEAAGKYLAHQLFGFKEESCTAYMANNQLKMNGFTNYDFQKSIKIANTILKNEYNLQLELINGYLFPKKIETIENKKIEYNLKKIDPVLKINGINHNFPGFQLYVYDSINNLSCINGSHHKTENVTMITKNCLGKEVKFNAFHCQNCGKYYTTVSAVKNDFPLIHYPFVSMKFYTSSDLFLNEQSELKIYGYSAQKNGLSSYERKNLLISLLHYEILTKHKIVQILQFNINFHQSNPIFSEAISKWEDDLEFIQNYGLEKQKTIKVDNVNVTYKGKKQ